MVATGVDILPCGDRVTSVADMTAVAVTAGTVDEQIGAAVHQLMWQNRITQRAMADALGIQQSAMSRKLRGTRPWLAAEVLVVARALGVRPADLMPDGDAEVVPPTPDGDSAHTAVESSTRRNFAVAGDAVLIHPQFEASRPAVVASATTADRDRLSA